MEGYGKIFIENDTYRQIIYEGYFAKNILCEWLVCEKNISSFIIIDSHKEEMKISNANNLLNINLSPSFL